MISHFLHLSLFDLLKDRCVGKSLGAKVKDFLKLLHEYASILRYKVIFAHGSRFQAKSLCVTWCLRVCVNRFFAALVDRYSAEGVRGSTLYLEPTRHVIGDWGNFSFLSILCLIK